jgi:hypothetical protein
VSAEPSDTQRQQVYDPKRLARDNGHGGRGFVGQTGLHAVVNMSTDKIQE